MQLLLSSAQDCTDQSYPILGGEIKKSCLRPSLRLGQIRNSVSNIKKWNWWRLIKYLDSFLYFVSPPRPKKQSPSLFCDVWYDNTFWIFSVFTTTLSIDENWWLNKQEKASTGTCSLAQYLKFQTHTAAESQELFLVYFALLHPSLLVIFRNIYEM